jgi:hypothetical protein
LTPAKLEDSLIAERLFHDAESLTVLRSALRVPYGNTAQRLRPNSVAAQALADAKRSFVASEDLQRRALLNSPPLSKRYVLAIGKFRPAL